MTSDQAVDRRTFLKVAGAVAAGGVVAAGIAAFVAGQPGEADALVAKHHDGPLPEDPLDGDWTGLDHYVVPLILQQVTQPQAKELVVPSLRVRAMHNGERLAFHIEWEDETRDDIDAVARFRDAVAVQLPTVEEADAAAPATSITMGLPGAGTTPGQKVHILQWKASWQADIDRGRQTVKDAFPNMYIDVKPETLMSAEDAVVFYPGIFAGNAMSARQRSTPIEELVAAGFGSLTTLEEQEATGKGVHSNGRWHVVIERSMSAGDNRLALEPGGAVPVAFAVWSGSKQNRGARKQYATWLPMQIEEA